MINESSQRRDQHPRNGASEDSLESHGSAAAPDEFRTRQRQFMWQHDVKLPPGQPAGRLRAPRAKGRRHHGLHGRQPAISTPCCWAGRKACQPLRAGKPASRRQLAVRRQDHRSPRLRLSTQSRVARTGQHLDRLQCTDLQPATGRIPGSVAATRISSPRRRSTASRPQLGTWRACRVADLLQQQGARPHRRLAARQRGQRPGSKVSRSAIAARPSAIAWLRGRTFSMLATKRPTSACRVAASRRSTSSSRVSRGRGTGAWTGMPRDGATTT